MTKRWGDSNFVNNKKLKSGNSIAELWGDEIDDSDINKCFELATQIWNKNEPDVSILPSYGAFEQTTHLLASTQSNPNEQASSVLPPILKVKRKEFLNQYDTKFKRTGSLDNLGNQPQTMLQIQKLKDMYESKVGEVSILRSQLKEVQASKDNELRRQQKEWSDKLNATVKELNSIKSETEFKNLEITNLKQTVVEVAKYTNPNSTFNSRNSTKNPTVCETSVTDIKEFKSTIADIILNPVEDIKYPLQDAIPAIIFSTPVVDKYVTTIDNKELFRSVIAFEENQLSFATTDQLNKLQAKVKSIDGEDQPLNFAIVYPDLAYLMKRNQYELELEENWCYMNQIICVSEQLLQNLHDFILNAKNTATHDTVNNSDLLLLRKNLEKINLHNSPFSAQKYSKNELCIGLRQSVACISEMLSCSHYVRGYLLYNKPLVFNEPFDYIQKLPIMLHKTNNPSNTFNYIKLLLETVSCIRILKKWSDFSGYLASVMMLLNKICLCCDIYDIRYVGIIYSLTQETIMCTWNSELLRNLSEYLKNASSLHNDFVHRLCKMNCTSEVQAIKNNGTNMTYNIDTCMMQVICIVFKRVLTIQPTKDLEIYSNFVKFTANILRCNSPWVFYQENKQSECLSMLVKLYIDVLHEIVTMFQAEVTTDFTDNIEQFFEPLRSGISILHTLNFKAYDLIVKYIATYSPYKVIVKVLLDSQNILKLSENKVKLLEHLMAKEDVPIQEINTFSNIELWNHNLMI